jgi:hypothetical protein
LVVDVADPLEVIEQVMRYFAELGVHGAKNKAPIDDVQKCFNKALYAASLGAPYRHARLSAVKHIDNADTIDGISANPAAARQGLHSRGLSTSRPSWRSRPAIPQAWRTAPFQLPEIRCWPLAPVPNDATAAQIWSVPK